jgi:hypothetical protein
MKNDISEEKVRKNSLEIERFLSVDHERTSFSEALAWGTSDCCDYHHYQLGAWVKPQIWAEYSRVGKGYSYSTLA